jgi:hypothetical protein
MPNAKRVQQDREAAEKRYLQYGQQIESYNAEIGQVNSANQAASDLYNQQAADYNNFVNQVKTGQVYGVGEYAPGLWGTVGGDGSGGLKLINVDSKTGKVQDSAPRYKSFEEYKAANVSNMFANNAWVDNGDGTTSLYAQAIGGLGNVEGGKYFKSNTMRALSFDTPTPTPQDVTQPEPVAPKPWNPSRREVAELANPTVDQAGAAQAMARGEFANQGVLGEAAARSQQLADPNEEPLTSSNKGILARVMGGEI